jgi:hypothetical protein
MEARHKIEYNFSKAIKTKGYGPVTAVAGTNEFRAVLRLAFLRTHGKLTEGEWAEFQSLYISKELRVDNASFREHSKWIGGFIVLINKDRS